MKPICTKCNLETALARTGAVFEEHADFSKPGMPDDIQPYQLWLCDAFACNKCGQIILANFAVQPFSRHLDEDFEEMRRKKKEGGWYFIDGRPGAEPEGNHLEIAKQAYADLGNGYPDPVMYQDVQARAAIALAEGVKRLVDILENPPQVITAEEKVEIHLPANDDFEAEKKIGTERWRRIRLITNLIGFERLRQIEKEGFDYAHDDQHDSEELAQAAVYYAWPANQYIGADNTVTSLFPYQWSKDWMTKSEKSRRRQLVIAAALIVAEIERLDRRDYPMETADVPTTM